MRLFACLLVVLGSSLLTACGDAITRAVNAKFPPVNVEEQRRQAIDSTAEALARMPAPNVAVSINIGDVRKAIFNDSLRKQGVKELVLRAQEQLVEVTLSFDRTFDSTDAGKDEDLRTSLATLRPRIAGSISAYFGITGAVAGSSGSASTIDLRLLLGLADLRIDRLELQSTGWNVTEAGELLARTLTKYKDNITGEVSRSPLSRISVPAVAANPIDIARGMKIGATAVQLDASGVPASVPIRLSGLAWLLHGDRVTAILQLSPASDGKEIAELVKLDREFKALRDHVDAVIRDTFDMDAEESNTWMGIRKDLLAFSLNSVINQSALCVTASGSSKQALSSKVPMPSGANIECSSDRNCQSNRVCTFNANKDERDCRTCIIGRPRLCSPRICALGGCVGGGCTGGGCAQYGNDPVCELAKAAQNTAYLADANVRKADCDRLRETETVGCQVEEAGKIGLCKAGREVLNGLYRTGNFANLDVEANVQANDMKLCFQNFNLSPGLEKVAFAVDLQGKAAADVNVKFVPLDIVGHLACAFPWRDRRKFQAALQDKVGFNADLKLVFQDDKARTDFTIAETTVKVKIDPSPTEFLMTSPGMTVSCQGLNLLKPLVIGLTPFLPQLRGEIDRKIDAQQGSLELPLPMLDVGGFKLKTSAKSTAKALVVTGALEEMPNVARP